MEPLAIFMGACLVILAGCATAAVLFGTVALCWGIVRAMREDW